MQPDVSTSASTAATSERDRKQLAACVRLLHREGLLTYNGHVSLRVPGSDAFVIHALVDSRSEIAPERLLTVTFDGDVLDVRVVRELCQHPGSDRRRHAVHVVQQRRHVAVELLDAGDIGSVRFAVVADDDVDGSVGLELDHLGQR